MVTVRYFAAARAARGSSTDSLPHDGHLGSLLEKLGDEHTTETAGGMTLAQVFVRCSFLLNGVPVGRDAMVGDGDQLDILPPFAGG